MTKFKRDIILETVFQKFCRSIEIKRQKAQLHKGRIKKWKFKIAFAMKGGGVSCAITYFEK